MRFHDFASALAIAAAVPTVSYAQDAPVVGTQSETLEQLARDVFEVLSGERSAQDIFSTALFAEVNDARLQATQTQLEAQVGELVSLESVTPGEAGGTATAIYRYEQALVSVILTLSGEEPGKLSGILVTGAEPITDTSTPVAEQVAALPGEANILFARLDGSETLISHEPDSSLALGSTFKLYVLSTLVQEIAAGQRSWDDTVTLSTSSYPSGIMQDWPQGSPVTLHTLASLMISISDNTATDQLIMELGREAIEREIVASGNAAPERSSPLMTTRELFLLKAAAESGIENYGELDRAERLLVLEALAERDVPLDQLTEVFSGDPQRIDVEWFASPREIGQVFDRIRIDPVALDILAINTALPPEAVQGWDYVGYKGGSEPGVLNMSWLLRNQAGEWYVMSLGWNDPESPVGTAQLLGLAQAALAEARRD